MTNYIVRVEHLSKQYKIGQYRGNNKSIRESLMQSLSSTIHGLRGTRKKSMKADSEIWALQDVCFEISPGEVIGMIGRNGAGKSTLLKILSRITEPTNGEIHIRGRVGSLLEVGTGFHSELTGRENIFLNGAILGMSHQEILRKFDAIVEFAEIGKFIDTPAKHYSSGMYMRLAFAVAAHLEPEILLVDEVLAVGDIQFQQKCLGKMSDVAGEGRTIIFVSHNMPAIQTLCSRVIVLDRGQIQFEGRTPDGIGFYTEKANHNYGLVWQRPLVDDQIPIYFSEIRVQLLGKQPYLVLNCELTLIGSRSSSRSFVSVDIADHSLTTIMQATPELQPFITGDIGIHKVLVEIELPPLVPGIYVADFWVGSHNTTTYDYIRQAVSFEVDEAPSSGRTFPYTPDHGYIVPISHHSYTPPNLP